MEELSHSVKYCKHVILQLRPHCYQVMGFLKDCGFEKYSVSGALMPVWW